MNWIFFILCLASAFFFSLGFSYYLISYARGGKFLDIPNNRSSHTVPTPRGGGISIALAVIIFMMWIGFEKIETESNIVWLGATLFFIALVAVIDDIKGKGLSTVIRACLYFLIASIFVLLVNKSSMFNLQGKLFVLVAALLLAWATNLYNFMDGADGLAAIQALIVIIPVGFMFYLSGHQEMASLCFVAATSTTGFLLWNWPPAKIFMGDVGSCSLGFFIGGLAFISYTQEIFSIFIWLILHSVFVVDASLTLIRRMLAGEEWYRAHRSHAYQRYLILGHSHKQLAVKVIMLGLFALWPLACLAYQYPQYKLHITIFVYTFLSSIWYFIQIQYKRSELR